jgi:hypothetical protein
VGTPPERQAAGSLCKKAGFWWTQQPYQHWPCSLTCHVAPRQGHVLREAARMAHTVTQSHSHTVTHGSHSHSVTPWLAAKGTSAPSSSRRPCAHLLKLLWTTCGRATGPGVGWIQPEAYLRATQLRHTWITWLPLPLLPHACPPATAYCVLQEGLSAAAQHGSEDPEQHNQGSASAPAPAPPLHQGCAP